MRNISFIPKGLLLVFCLVILSFQAKGQFGYIMELELLPEPSNNMQVTDLRVYTMWLNHNEGMVSSEVSRDENIINVKMCYFLMQDLPGGTYTADTISIGLLDMGNYTIVLDLYITGDCDSVVISDTLQFQVTQGTGTQITAREAGITLQPNPFTDHFTVQVAQNALHRPVSLRLYDYSGREVLFGEMESGTTHRISTAHLPSGIYLYRLELENGQEVNGKIVKY